MLLKTQKRAIILLLPILAGFHQASSTYSQEAQVPFKAVKLLHKPSHLSQSQINTLASLTNIKHMNTVLDNICIPRVVGTPGHQKVKQYIKSSLEKLDWFIETDKFQDHTPLFGKLMFENIIAKFNPDATRFLALACHYDSKYVKNYDFIGATDSAVPCMQLINLAKVMQSQLDSIKNNSLSLMLIFFDGEEAFKSWGPKDSLYGARHLAEKWYNNKYIVINTDKSEEDISDLDKIDLFVLLDLIGDTNPTFYNYFNNTKKWYSLMLKAESYLAKAKQFQNYPHKKYFQDYTFSADIQDDHIPFLNKAVPILHLIPHPFPKYWHTVGDNRKAISMTTIENLNKILRVFVASYLNIPVQEELIYDNSKNEYEDAIFYEK